MDGHIQEIRSRLRGSVNCIPTTFTRDGEIDWPGVRNLMENGVGGGFGTNLLTYGSSQFEFLSDQEVADVTKVLVEQTAGRAMTVACTKYWWTGKTLEFARYCRDIGVDMLMVLPSNMAKGVDGKVALYKAVAKVMPVMLIGAPSHQILDELVDEPRICAFKEDGPALDYATDIMMKYPDRWEFMTGGSHHRHLMQWPFGCKANMSWTACFAPGVDQRYWQALHNNDLATAADIVANVEMPVFKLMARFPEDIEDVWRGALELNGVAQRYLRPPRRSLTDADMEDLADVLVRVGLMVPH